MNIGRLRTFIVLTEYLNFSEAAEYLFCSQPTVSMQIRTLEEELGCVLFDRVGKKIHLNQQGEAFKPYAEKIINLWQESKDNAQQISSGEQGTLAFGASNFVGVYLIPSILNSFKTSYTKVKVNIQIRSSPTLLKQLENNDVEFLVLSDKIKVNENHYQTNLFYQDELILVVPPGHPLAEKQNVQPYMIENYTLLWKPKHSATREFLEQMLKGHLISISNYMEISSLEAIKQGVIHSLGIAFISRFAVSQELKSGILKHVFISDLNIKRGIMYVTRKDKILSPAAKRFISLLPMIKEQNSS
ncbi:LysR family transcriptional regulator [Jinshanibacter sp. LJY008]|uniref:LysR family transcriptional regulator n=1 Tax=Limnobaculum eriocheiris TaxID=2897391 RepID=A0A9X1SNM6_9GAMM|nr:LysR family transcriptional regulator [Limnobaculum eriocheiris]MCD1125152.1 LysR family transcriptional regulator [Limnobaculum eriocheiris]